VPVLVFGRQRLLLCGMGHRSIPSGHHRRAKLSAVATIEAAQ
jgi:hypothetical protein